MLPLAHAGHYVVWALYALPVIIVVAAIVRSTLAQRREDERAEDPAADTQDELRP